MKRSSAISIGVILIVIFLFIACACLVLGAGGLLIFNAGPRAVNIPGAASETSTPAATPRVIRPATRQATPAAPLEPATPGTLEVPATIVPPLEGFSVPTDTLQLLSDTIVPVNNLIELAERLEGKQDIPETLDPPPAPFEAGAQQSFWVTNTDNNQNFQVQATLRYITDHLYFWVQDGVAYNPRDLQRLADTFENEIYPINREFFGSEWTPGVDGDPHLYILYAGGLGGSVAGYFSSVDEVPPQANEFSNAHEMFLISADLVRLEDEYAYSVLAHEFQHMIHWYRDRNEDTWMNEGFSSLAMFLNGYSIGGHDFLYTLDPDIQLTTWPDNPESRTPHYGSSFLFLTYFLDRFGEDATKALVAEPENGMVSIDKVLADNGVVDEDSNETLSADEVFADWVVTSYLQDASVGDGRFTYHNYSNAPKPSETEQLDSCPVDWQTRDVSQYGVDYIRINCRGEFNLRFEGTVQVGVLPEDPYSGAYAFWSNQGDESDMTLTREFDFSSHSGPLTFSYWTWYDLEKDYDYLYLEASLDGETWQILQTPSGTEEDPSGNSYGWAYNGPSGGNAGPQWIQESVDISQFAGQRVQLRFEYITDAAVNGEGFLLDDVAITEAGYISDFENDDGGWQADGFVRIQNILPQTFRLALISHGRATTVDQFSLSGDNAIDIPLSLGDEIDEATLVVSGTTRFTRQKAAYRFEIQPGQ